jgi:diacylglycerol kinase (ATP)
LLLISNQASGSSDEQSVARVARELEALGPVETLRPGSEEELDRQVAAEVRSGDLTVVAGGDGTLNRAINALKDRLEEVVIAVVPMGTGNDFARTLGMPADPVEAAAAVVRGRSLEVDVARATGEGEDRLFLNACMGGFPVEVDEAVDDSTKRRLGPLAFWVGGLKAAADLPRFSVSLNGMHLEDCLAVGIGSGKTAGGGIEVFPQAHPSDGKLDACGLSAPNISSALRLAAKVRVGEHNELDGVRTLRSERIDVTSTPQLEFNLDGELVGLGTPARFEIAGRVRMRVPD